MTHNNILTPSTLRMDDFSQVKLLEYLKPIHDKNKLITQFGVCQFAHGVAAVPGAYRGGVYSPTQNRIYLVPYMQSNQTNWHYIDCSNGTVVAYAHGVTAVVYAYAGGVYSPTQNRIYLVPCGQSNQTNWHYLQEYSIADVAPSLAANGLFNKF